MAQRHGAHLVALLACSVWHVVPPPVTGPASGKKKEWADPNCVRFTLRYRDCPFMVPPSAAVFRQVRERSAGDRMERGPLSASFDRLSRIWPMTTQGICRRLQREASWILAQLLHDN